VRAASRLASTGRPRGSTIAAAEPKEDRLAPAAPAPTPNRRFTDASHAAVTLIGSATHIRGDVVSSDAMEIRGTVEGDCRVGSHCTVTEGARVLGNIDATTLVVAGEVEAGTLTAQKIEIRASARVRATIRALRVAIADGALYEGDLQTQDPGSAAVVFQERRASDETKL
jgi:cytoskeletal protein CcmA (bactofilin family)